MRTLVRSLLKGTSIGFALAAALWISDPAQSQDVSHLYGGPSSSGASWGSITGTLSNQTDLNTALSGKVPLSGNSTINGTVSIDGGAGSGTLNIQGNGSFPVINFIEGGTTWGYLAASGAETLFNATASMDIAVAGSRTLTANTTAVNIETGKVLQVNGTTILNSSGVLQAAGFPALTGDVTTSAGSLATTLGTVAGAVKSSSSSAGVGYATGAGGTVTQLTSRTTGVTCSRVSCGITLFSTTTTAGQTTSTTVTNTTVTTTDVIACSQQTGSGVYFITTKAGSGSFVLSVYTPTAVGSAEAPVINCVVLKGVSA